MPIPQHAGLCQLDDGDSSGEDHGAKGEQEQRRRAVPTGPQFGREDGPGEDNGSKSHQPHDITQAHIKFRMNEGLHASDRSKAWGIDAPR